MFHVLPHGELRNLILAVIVEKAAEAREKDSARKKEKKDQEREAHLVELAMLFDSMDENCNGKLSLEEMLNGFDCNPKFRQLMDFMDIAASGYCVTRPSSLYKLVLGSFIKTVHQK